MGLSRLRFRATEEDLKKACNYAPHQLKIN